MNFASLDTQLDPQLVRLVEWNKSGEKTFCEEDNKNFGLGEVDEYGWYESGIEAG